VRFVASCGEICRVVYRILNSNQGTYDDEAYSCDGSSCALPDGMRWRRGKYFSWRREHKCQFQHLEQGCLAGC
jgi:hypothetical protein